MDKLFGEGGNDLLLGSPGHDLLNGGLGEDTAQYQGGQADYTFLGVTDNFTVQGPGIGKDTLIESEFLSFTGDNTLVATANLFL